MLIAVGSENPVKVAAVKEAFEKVFPKTTWEIKGIDVGSDVSDQPMSDVESITGATNRATKAMKALKADYGVGLEGGLQELNGEWFDSGWTVICSKQGKRGIGSSIRMEMPEKFMDLIRQGHELGAVSDMMFGTKNSKHSNGHFGLMTNNAITRKSCYIDGIIAALSRFVHPELF